MSPTEVLGVEIKQYVGRDNLKTFVPRIVGQTEQARTQKIGGGERRASRSTGTTTRRGYRRSGSR